MKNNLEFKNKTVLVTGGSKGIGRSICLHFARLGAKTIFTFRKKDNSVKSLLKIKFERKKTVYGYKVSNLNNNPHYLLKEIRKKHKEIHFLINNVGDAIKRTSFKKSSPKLWNESYITNLQSTVETTRALLKNFNNNKIRTIINIGSVAGKSGGQGDSLHYGVMKSAIHTFSVGLSRELKNTRVLCVAPNAINTSFQKRLSSKERIRKIKSNNALNRLGTAEEVSNLVLFLCSEKASYLNGEVIYITGGIK